MVLHSHTNDKVWLNDCWIVIMDYWSVLLCVTTIFWLLLYYDYYDSLWHILYIYILLLITMITYDLWWICMDSSGFWYNTWPQKMGQAGPHLPVLRLAGRPLREFTSTDTCRDLRCRLEGAAAGFDGRYGDGSKPLAWDGRNGCE